MASIEQIKASDGSDNASVATVQSSRSPGASTIIVDTVLGINVDGFAGSMGTPHTFQDPITSETITVISEATAVDFTGHVDGSNLEIDDIAPGYTDIGSEIGDIIIIRPTTQYADNLAEVLETAHNDDGSLKDDVVTTDVIADDAVTAPKIVGLDRGNLTVDLQPYKFSVYRNAALTPASPGLLAADTKIYDTNTNVDVVTNKGRFTAPFAGFYSFKAWWTATIGNGSFFAIYLYKNGSVISVGNSAVQGGGGPFTASAVVTDDLQLATNDYIEVFVYLSGAALAVGPTANGFRGHLISRT